MTGFEAAGLYAGLFAIFMMALKLNVGRARQANKVAFGDGGQEPVQRAIRVQGNAVEDVPFGLVGLFALAAMGAGAVLIHVLGGLLFVSRLLHAVGLGGSSGTSFGRFAGTLGSILAILAIGVACLYFALV